MCCYLTLTCVEHTLYLQSEVSVLYRIGVRKESGFINEKGWVTLLHRKRNQNPFGKGG
jgi:hypothetical protein